MKYKFKEKFLATISLLFIIINSMLSFANATKASNFKILRNANESYSCVKYRDEEKCDYVDDYGYEEKCTTVEGEKSCRTVDDYEDKTTCTPKYKEKCTTSPSTTKNGKCKSYSKKEKCTVTPERKEEYNCKTVKGSCTHYNSKRVCETTNKCTKWETNKWEADAGLAPYRKYCVEYEKKCHYEKECTSYETKRVCDTRTIPSKKKCTTVNGACNSYEKITVPGKTTCETVKDGESCTTTRVKVGSHEECSKGDDKRVCESVRVKKGKKRECRNESVSYYSTCSRNTSSWTDIDMNNEEENSIISQLKSYAIIYKGDTLTLDDILNGSNMYDIRITKQPDTSSLGEKTYEISANVNSKNYKIRGIAHVIDKPKLKYKSIRTTTVNKKVLADEIYEDIVIENDLYTKDRYNVVLSKNVDTSRIGLAKAELKVIDKIKNKEFLGYQSDVSVQEEMMPIVFKDDIEAYIGDSLDVSTVVLDENIPSGYNISLLDSKQTNEGYIRVKIKSSAGSIWQVNVPSKILKKPDLIYKSDDKTSKEEGYMYVADDIVDDIIIDSRVSKYRYTYEIIGKVDTSEKGPKNVNFKILDTKLNREFLGYSHTVNVLAKMKHIDFKDTPIIYVEDVLTIDDFVERNNIPKNYTIEFKKDPDTSTSGEKEVAMIVKDTLKDSVWNISKKVIILDKPRLIYENLWIYQNSKEADKKGKEFISQMKVDLNEKFKNRYSIEYVEKGDIGEVKISKFVYLVRDKVLNREFRLTADVEVREETINAKINNDVEYSLNEKINIDDLISNVDKNKYDIVIENESEIDITKEGEKTVKIKVISKESLKEFRYNARVVYKDSIIRLESLIWDLGKKLTVDRIKELRGLSQYESLELLSPSKLRYDKVEEYEAKIKLVNKNGGHKIALIRIIIKDGKILNDIDKIVLNDKVNLVSNLTNLSEKIEDRLINVGNRNKYNNLWIEQDNNFNKYIVNSNNSYKIALKIGYDRLLNNDNTMIGGYVSYANKTHNLSAKSNEHLIKAGIYGGHNINDYVYVGGIINYTNILGDINIKNVNDEIDKFKRVSHNMLTNIFVGIKKEYQKDSYISATFGNSLFFGMKDKFSNKYDEIKINSNVSDEIYTKLKVNKLVNDKINVYADLKASAVISKQDINFNNVVKKNSNIKDNTLGNFELGAGFDYYITDNLTIGAKASVNANTKKNVGVNGTLNLSYNFDDKLKRKAKKQNYEDPKYMIDDYKEYIVGEQYDIDELVYNYDKDKYSIKVLNEDDIDINKAGNKQLFVLLKSVNSNRTYSLIVNLKYIEIETTQLIVNFEFDSYNLTSENKIKIKSFLENKKFVDIIIKGHTDNKGTKEYNKKLSEKRAKVVYEYIKNTLKYEISSNYIGEGMKKPISEFDYENRRTEINIIY